MIMKSETSPTLNSDNNPGLFPNLNLDALVEQAHVWGATHESIERITLYLNHRSRPGQNKSLPRYTIAVEIQEDAAVKSLNELKRTNPETMREIRDAFRQEAAKRRKKQEDNPEAPIDPRPLGTFFLEERKESLSEKAVEILENTEEVSNSTWFETTNQFQPDNIHLIADDSFPLEVIKPNHLAQFGGTKKDALSWWDEWVIYPCSPGEIPEDVSKEYSWMLYDSKKPPLPKKKSSLTPTQKTVRTIQSGYFHERRIFEDFARRYIKGKDPLPRKADTIRSARDKYPDTFKNVSNKRMREWLAEIYPKDQK